MKSGIAGLLKFAGGSAFGAALGATIGVLMAPRSGEETRAYTAEFVQTARAEGELARQAAEERAAAHFRREVGDPTALTTNS
jgi:gas vesicle protein